MFEYLDILEYNVQIYSVYVAFSDWLLWFSNMCLSFSMSFGGLLFI